MTDIENKHMNEMKDLGVKFWLRFVDDTFVIINNKANAEIILNFLNEQHTTIKFTMEKQIKNSLNLSNKISSNDEQKIIEMEQLRDLLLRNNYPIKIIEREFEKFI